MGLVYNTLHVHAQCQYTEVLGRRVMGGTERCRHGQGVQAEGAQPVVQPE